MVYGYCFYIVGGGYMRIDEYELVNKERSSQYVWYLRCGRKSKFRKEIKGGFLIPFCNKIRFRFSEDHLKISMEDASREDLYKNALAAFNEARPDKTPW